MRMRDRPAGEPPVSSQRDLLRVLRAIWFPATLALDLLQFLVFPCSREPLLAFVFGFLTFGPALALPISLIETWTDPWQPVATKVLRTVVTVVVLSALVCVAGFVVLYTHMCT